MSYDWLKVAFGNHVTLVTQTIPKGLVQKAEVSRVVNWFGKSIDCCLSITEKRITLGY